MKKNKIRQNHNNAITDEVYCKSTKVKCDVVKDAWLMKTNKRLKKSSKQGLRNIVWCDRHSQKLLNLLYGDFISSEGKTIHTAKRYLQGYVKGEQFVIFTNNTLPAAGKCVPCLMTDSNQFLQHRYSLIMWSNIHLHINISIPVHRKC